MDTPQHRHIGPFRSGSSSRFLRAEKRFDGCASTDYPLKLCSCLLPAATTSKQRTLLFRFVVRLRCRSSRAGKQAPSIAVRVLSYAENSVQSREDIYLPNRKLTRGAS